MVLPPSVAKASRDHAITPLFRQVAHRISLNTLESASWEEGNIQIFFEQRFAEITSKYPSLQSWPGTAIIRKLTDRAAGLFIWANTIIQFIDQGLPKQQLNLILSGTFYEKGDAISKLYQQILRLSFNNPRGCVSDTFKKVIGAIVVAKTPVHCQDLIHFLNEQEVKPSINKSSIDFILNNFTTVISTRTSDHQVHISHLSFTEFVCNQTRCNKAFIIGTGMFSSDECGVAVQYLWYRNIISPQWWSRPWPTHWESHSQLSVVFMYFWSRSPPSYDLWSRASRRNQDIHAHSTALLVGGLGIGQINQYHIRSPDADSWME